MSWIDDVYTEKSKCHPLEYVCSPVSSGDPARRAWFAACLFQLPGSLSAIPGMEEATATSFHLIISFVLRNKSSQSLGGKIKTMEEQGTPQF